MEDLIHFKEEHSEVSASIYYSNESSENKVTEEEKEILEPFSINSSFKRIRIKADEADYFHVSIHFALTELMVL